MPTCETTKDNLLSFRTWTDLIVVFGLLTTFETYLSINQNLNGFFVLLVFFMIFLGYLVATAYNAVTWLSRSRPKLAAASFVKLAVVLLPVLFGISIGDYIHLALYYTTYRRQIEAQGDGNTAPVRFFWGDRALWVTDGLQADTLVYDPTDALAASIGTVREANQAGLDLETQHLIGHFYLEHESSR